MQQPDLTVLDDIRAVREAYDNTVFPFLVNYREELLEKAESSIATAVRKLYKLSRVNSDFLSLLDTLGELRDELDALSDSMTERDRIQDFYQALGTWQHDLPIRREYPQAAVCYSKLPSDSAYNSVGKALKRSRVSIKTGIHSSKTWIRKAIGKQSSSLKPEFHEIRWIRVSKSLSVELLEQMAIISYQDFALFSKIAALLNDTCDRGSDVIQLEQQGRVAENLLQEIRDIRATNSDRIKEVSDEVFDQIMPLVEFMGTFQESKHHFNTKILDSRDTKAIKSIRRLKSDWRKDCRTRLSQLKIDIALHRFNALALKELEAYQTTTSSSFRDVKSVAEKAASYLRKYSGQFKRFKPNDIRTERFNSELESANAEINQYLNLYFSDRIIQTFDQLDPATSMESVLSNTILNDELLPDQSYVFDKETQEPVKAQTTFEVLNFRNELTTYIKNDLFRKLRKIPAEVTSEVEKLKVDIDEILQVASVNIKLALELIANEDSREDDEKVLELVHLGIDRAAKRIDEFVIKLDKLSARNLDSTDGLFSNYLGVARKTMIDDNYLYIRSKNREALVVSKSLDWKTQIETSLIETWDRLIVWYRFALKFTHQLYAKGQQILGFKRVDDESGYVRAGAAEFLSETEQRLSELPLIYRRLFSDEALNETRFFRGRTITQSLFTEAYSSWNRGHFANFMIVGEKGSGKTSCMNLIPKLVQMDHPVIHGSIKNTIWSENELVRAISQILGLDQVETKEALIDAINATNQRRVVLLEGFQNLFLRHIQGFEALEAFLLIISKTSSRIFWVLSGSRYAWELLNKMYQVAGYFSHTTNVDAVTSEVIQDVILTRHRVSGYDLQFLPSKELKASRAYKKMEAEPANQQNLVKAEFFKGLSKVAQGNISIAILYWLRSIRNTGLDSIEISPFSEVNVTLGDAFSSDDLFALASVVQHDELSVTELALTLNCSDQESRLLLSKLAARSIVIEKNHRYFLNPLLYRHAVNLLKLKNIIH